MRQATENKQYSRRQQPQVRLLPRDKYLTSGRSLHKLSPYVGYDTKCLACSFFPSHYFLSWDKIFYLENVFSHSQVKLSPLDEARHEVFSLAAPHLHLIRLISHHNCGPLTTCQFLHYSFQPWVSHYTHH